MRASFVLLAVQVWIPGILGTPWAHVLGRLEAAPLAPRQDLPPTDSTPEPQSTLVVTVTATGPPPPAGTAAPQPVPQPPVSVPGSPQPPAGDWSCPCGYTFCGHVLQRSNWPDSAIVSGYCGTPGAACPDGRPATAPLDALYVCMCDADSPVKTSKNILLLAECNTCLDQAPDYIGRCDVPAKGDCA